MNRRGLTLIELLVSMGILVVILVLVFAGWGSSRAKAAESSSLQSLRQLALAAELYRADSGEYPVSARFLVAQGRISREQVSFSQDQTPAGMAELVATDAYRGLTREAPPLSYRLTPSGFLEWAVQNHVQRFSEQAPDGGWLVDLSVSELPHPGNPLIFSRGFYRRLLYDGSVQRFPHKDTIQDESGQVGRTPSLLFFTETEEYRNWTESRER